MSVYTQAAALYAAGKPFGLFRHCWGEMTVIEHCSRQSDGTLVFGNYTVCPWPFDKDDKDYPSPPFTPTSHDEYVRDLTDLIESFNESDDKTVIVRKIVGDVKVDLTNPEIFAAKFQDYFDNFRVEFCYAFFTPETGLWFGASPELLLSKYRDSAVKTQALAGTRGKDQSWTDKDFREHRIVVDDILSRIEPYGSVTCQSTEDSSYGDISHLCTRFSIDCTRKDYPKVLEAIYPTPAICGFPREEAIGNIHKFERFPRKFYTGILSFSDENYMVDYAVLRCAHVEGDKYEIFTGSGIISDSDPESEWLETEAKAAPLRNFFNDNK